MPFKKYLISLFSMISLFLVFTLSSIIFMYRSDELKTLPVLVSEQISENKIANIVKSPLLPYRIEMYAQMKPEIIILGSSTAMLYRQSMFTRPIYNLGGAGWGPYESAYVLEQVLKIHKPKFILFSQDIFTLCDNANEINKSVSVPGSVTGFHAINRGYDSSISAVLDLFKKGHLSISDYMKVIFTDFTTTGYSANFFGVFGKISLRGIARDGSKVNASTLLDKSKLPFNVKNDSHFEVCKSSKFRFEMLEFLISRVQKMGVKILGFLPPLAPSAYQEIFIKNDKLLPLREQYRNFRFRSSKVGFDEYFDFTNPDAVNAHNCEFIDNIHFGDVVAAKVILKMLQKKSNLMVDLSNLDILKSMVNETWGYNSIVYDDYLKPLKDSFIYQRDNSPKCP